MNLKIILVIKLGSFCTQEDILSLCVHFGVTWFPKGNIEMCNLNHA